jgi:hypothetical protein
LLARAPDIYAKNNARDFFVEVKNIQLDDEDYIFGKKALEAKILLEDSIKSVKTMVESIECWRM